MNDLITNGEAKNDEPKNSTSHLDRMESTLSYVIGQLVEHHVKKAVEAKFEAVARLGRIIDKLETELGEVKADQVSANKWDFEMSDTVNDLINERLDERDAERNDAEDASEYVKIEDLPDAIRDCFTNGEVTFNVDVS